MKRIVCCLDGTWNSDENDDELTNIVKLHRAVAPADASGVRQFSFYIRGIASDGNQKTKFLRGAVGAEVGDRIKQAYLVLQNHYDPGDEIYIFGFSRGAFEARSLASFIHLFGVAQSASPFAIEDAWKVYKQPQRRRDALELARLQGYCRRPAAIACLGVFDTVGNIGNPILDHSIVDRKLAFHDMRIHDNVATALHALSIDEKRGPFSPVLFTRGQDESPNDGQRVEQVWFSGTHADVGGGWKETELSDIALLWMARRTEALSSLRFDWARLSARTFPNPLGLQHASATGRIFKWSNAVPYIRLINQQRGAIPLLRRLFCGTWRTNYLGRGVVSINERIHESAFARAGKVVMEQVNGRDAEIVYAPSVLVRPQFRGRPPQLKPQGVR